MIRATSIFAAVAAVMLSGCGSMSGLSGSSNFACQAAPGVSCVSMSGVHQNAMAQNLPFQKEEAAARAGGADADTRFAGVQGAPKVSPRDMNAAFSGMPVRQPPLVLRIWVAPFEDEGGDLHDQSYFYTMVHSGKWMIEANRGNISRQFRPIYPLNNPTQQNHGDAPAAQPTQPNGVGVGPGNYDGLVGKTAQ